MHYMIEHNNDEYKRFIKFSCRFNEIETNKDYHYDDENKENERDIEDTATCNPPPSQMNKYHGQSEITQTQVM